MPLLLLLLLYSYFDLPFLHRHRRANGSLIFNDWIDFGMQEIFGIWLSQ